MTAQRERLPDRRASELFDIEVNGRKYRCTSSRFADGRLAEIFIGNNRVNSDSDIAAKDSAVVCSIALQYGVPLDTIRKALMRDSRGRPNGPLGAALVRHSWGAAVMPRPAMPANQRAAHAAELKTRKAEEAVERTWRGLPPEFDGAASSTVEALMLSLRGRGTAALVEESTLRRLSELSPRQVREVIDRLQKLRDRYPAISDGLIASILEIKK